MNGVSGTLCKSNQKSKFVLKSLDSCAYIFDDERPRLDSASKDEIVVLQVMLVNEQNVLVEYVSRKDFDDMYEDD